MRAVIPAIVLFAVTTTGISPAAAGAAGRGEDAPPPAATATAQRSFIVVAPFFQDLVDDLVAGSATLRAQYQRILSASRVGVWIQPPADRQGGRSARARITRSTNGLVLARVELSTPLRTFEYAEMLAHELEHVLEQIEGVRLHDLAGGRSGEATVLYDGSYETERARQAGRAAALEIEHHAGAPRP
jgi:hypothetical protein